MYKWDLSRIALFVASAWILLVGFFYYPRWNYPETEAAISWDVSGYYFYLPAIFIYKDLKQQKFKQTITDKYNPTPDPYQSYMHRSGKLVMKYSSGMAVLYLPAFTIAHLLAKPLGYPPDGFSFPYQVAIGIWSLLISLAGLYFLRRILIRYFSPPVVATCLLILVFATNYLEYAAITGELTHNYLFTLYAILLLVTDNYYRKPKLKMAFLIGLLVGLMTLIRPTEMISALLPVLWKLDSFQAIKQRILFFRINISHLFVAGAGAVLFGSIQLIYWKYVTGEWLVYSYGNEGFHFLRPHIYNCLFSFRKGWLVYTPVMLFAIAGFYFIYLRWRQFTGLLFFCAVFMYINFSWQTWWYAGSLSQRVMVQAYPVILFAMAAFITDVYMRRWKQVIFFPLLALFTLYNLWLHHHAHKGGLLDAEFMTKAYWKKVVFRNSVPVEAYKLLDTEDWYEGKIANAKVIYALTDSFRLSKDRQFTPEFPVKLNGDGWVRLEANAFFTDKEDYLWHMTQAVIRVFKKGEKVKENMIRLQRFVPPNVTTPFTLDAKIPSGADSLTFLFWNADSQKQIDISGVKMIQFK